LYTGQYGVDLFDTPKEALERVSMGKKILKSVTFAHSTINPQVNATPLLDIIFVVILDTW
jgi:hypothetical protein